MFRHNIILLLFFLSAKAFSQKFSIPCPIKGGKIIEYSYLSGGKVGPGAEFIGNRRTVLSPMEGQIESVDTTFKADGTIHSLKVRVKSGDYTFTWDGLEKVLVNKEQRVTSKERLGTLKSNENLFLIMNYKNELVAPKHYFKCGSLHISK